VASSSPAAANSNVPITYDVTWRWRRTAALGSPVVPDVNSMMATLSVSKSGTKSVASTDPSCSVSMTVSPSTDETRDTMSWSITAAAGAARVAIRTRSGSASR
jgi:hypothetical protein